jgi:hypothetical protein
MIAVLQTLILSEASPKPISSDSYFGQAQISSFLSYNPLSMRHQLLNWNQ